eukprot:4902817-Pyramimonas_sp.AAC.1
MQSSTEGPRGDVRMRPPRPEQRFVGPLGTPLKAPLAMFARVRPTQCSAPWPHAKLNWTSLWRLSHAL